MCVQCLQAVGVASGHQNSLQHQDTGVYALPNIDKNNNVQKVCKHLYVVTGYIRSNCNLSTYVVTYIYVNT